jgi:hypothetical protein
MALEGRPFGPGYLKTDVVNATAVPFWLNGLCLDQDM